MIFEYQDYRTFLKETLAERAKVREGYSLRGFSEKIGVSNSFLSEVLGKKKALSVELAFKIAVKLNLTEAETQYFCFMVQLEQEEDPGFREELSNRLKALNPKRETHDLSVDLFKTIADWYHFAILELTYLTGFRLEAASAAKKLGISKVEAEVAIDRLVRLELLDKEGSTYRKAQPYILTKSQLPNGAFKQHHRQILEKALQCIDSQDPSERMSATDIVPIDSRLLPKVERLSVEFSSAVLRLADKSTVKDSVYALSVHFINLTQKER